MASTCKCRVRRATLVHQGRQNLVTVVADFRQTLYSTKSPLIDNAAVIRRSNLVFEVHSRDGVVPSVRVLLNLWVDFASEPFMLAPHRAGFYAAASQQEASIWIRELE
jgi:hypothetical protein